MLVASARGAAIRNKDEHRHLSPMKTHRSIWTALDASTTSTSTLICSQDEFAAVGTAAAAVDSTCTATFRAAVDPAGPPDTLLPALCDCLGHVAVLPSCKPVADAPSFSTRFKARSAPRTRPRVPLRAPPMAALRATPPAPPTARPPARTTASPRPNVLPSAAASGTTAFAGRRSERAPAPRPPAATSARAPLPPAVALPLPATTLTRPPPRIRARTGACHIHQRPPLVRAVRRH